ncbi:MAG: NAD(P)H-hydrate dehydratase, partial [Mycobacteriaceae bacterium]
RQGELVGPALAQADLVVDGIVGLSAQGPLRPPAAAVVAAVRAPVVSVDAPSGVDPDTGAAHGVAVRAVVTVTFGALKPVHLLAAGRCGRVVTVPMPFALGTSDVGASDADASALGALEPADVAALWPVPGPDDDKYSQGVVGVVAGSATYPGAAVLCTGAAVTATSGMVRYAGTGRDAVLARFAEVVAVADVVEAGRVQAWAAGPGLGTGDEALGVLRHLLAQEVPVLLDADAITVVAQHRELLERDAPTLLTPHAGEFARLTGAGPGADRVGAVRAAARELGVSVLLKGRTTVLADPGGQVLVNAASSSWVSTAGAGDVLSGVIGALLAAGVSPLHAGAAGAMVHERAGELAAVRAGVGAPISATTLLDHLRDAIRDVRASC